MSIQNAADATFALPGNPVVKSLKSRHKGGVLPDIPVDRSSAYRGTCQGLRIGCAVLFVGSEARIRPGTVAADRAFSEWRRAALPELPRVSTWCKGDMPMANHSGLRLVSSRENPISAEMAAWLRDIRAMSSATYQPKLNLFEWDRQGDLPRGVQHGKHYAAVRRIIAKRRAAQ